jgi:hypothetical protein
MLEILGILIMVVGVVLLVCLVAAGFLILMGTFAGLDIYDHDEIEENEPTALLGVVSPKNHSNSKGDINA